MNDAKNIIGEVNVKVTAGLYVDDRTFRTCLDLIAIHAKQDGMKGLIMTMPREDLDGCNIFPIFTEQGLDCAFDGLESSDDERKAREKLQHDVSQG